MWHKKNILKVRRNLMVMSSQPVSLNLPPLGLMNLGLSCWWNSVLQIILHNPYLRDCIEFRADTSKMPLINHLQHLLYTIRQRDSYETYNCHVKLYKFILQLHPTFRESSMNDSHEVLTYVLNRLHEESSLPVPDTFQPKDAVSQAIMRDFDRKLSHVLHNIVCCTKRTTSDNTQIIETYTTLFVEPRLVDNTYYGIEEALNEKNYGFLPRCLFVSLIVGQRAMCRFSLNIKVQHMNYKLHSMVLFIPSMLHYVSVVSTDFVDHNKQPEWMLCNDQQITMINLADLMRHVGGDAYPTVVSYVQVDVV